MFAMSVINNSGTSGNFRILIIDDHAVVREGLRRILEAAERDWSITEAGTALQALEIMRHDTFDLAIVDLSMPGMNGLEFLRRARPEYPRMRVLVLSMHAEEQYAMRAFKAGASGYVTKDCASKELAGAVRKVNEGSPYVSSNLAERMVLQLSGGVEASRHSELSNRELDVLKRLVAGQRPTEIARTLHLSVKTISTHKRRILERLDLPNLAALVRYGLHHGLGPDEPGARELSH